MASCFVVVDNNLQLSTDPVETCTGFIVQTTAEYQSAINLQTLFSNFDIDNALFLFRGGFITVLGAWMISYFFKVIFEQFKD